MSPCPDPESLRRLGAESLDPDVFRALEAHVAGCGRCREVLEGFARSDATATTEPDADAAAPTSAPRIPGCVLGRVLGRGGSGVVYEAEQPALGRRVAVKVLAAAADLDAKARERWLREARAAARVRHPNVVRLHDAGEHDGRLYLVFDLVPGGSLRELASGPSPPDVAAAIVETIARAVEAIHRAGLLHLDVKPANILMDGPPGAALEDLTPMLSDFGIARETSEAAGATGTLGGRGTPAYMAPEQVAGRSGTVGPTADVFSLGATLYKLLTGRPPFQGASAFETMDLLLATEPPSPRALAPTIPRDLETICLKAMQKAPTRRYASAEALADDLARWREGRPIQARPVSNMERVARWCRRHPAPAALTAVLLLTATLALIGLTALWRRAEGARARATRGEASADRMVVNLAAMLRQAVEAPERFVSERSEDASRDVLALTADLRRSPELAARHATTVAALERKLAGFRRARLDYEGSTRLLDDAAGLLAIRFRSHPDSDAGARLAEAILGRAESVVPGGRLDAAIADVRRADDLLRNLPDGRLAREASVDLHMIRRYIVYWLIRTGRDGRARELARENAEGLAALARRFSGSPAVDLLARFARAEFEAGADPSAADWTREAYSLFPNGRGMPTRMEALLAHLNAGELLGLAVAAPGPSDPKAAAGALLKEYDDRCRAWNVSPRYRAETIEHLSQIGCVAAMEARRAGDFRKARSRVAWMIALGGMLADRPEVLGGGHVMASRAHEQEAKIGWAQNDPAAVDRGLRAALVEASLAFDEAPEELAPRVLIAGIREKYARFAAAEPERRGTVEAER